MTHLGLGGTYERAEETPRANVFWVCHRLPNAWKQWLTQCEWWKWKVYIPCFVTMVSSTQSRPIGRPALKNSNCSGSGSFFAWHFTQGVVWTFWSSDQWKSNICLTGLHVVMAPWGAVWLTLSCQWRWKSGTRGWVGRCFFSPLNWELKWIKAY